VYQANAKKIVANEFTEVTYIALLVTIKEVTLKYRVDTESTGTH